MPYPDDPHPMLGETDEQFRERERRFYSLREALKDCMKHVPAYVEERYRALLKEDPAMAYRVIEASESVSPSGRIQLVETLLHDDGSESVRRSLTNQRLYNTCSICGRKSDKEEFPASAIDCHRHDCSL